VRAGHFGDEDVSGKFEPSAQSSHVLYSEIALSSHEHRNCALRAKLRNEVTLCQVLLLNKKSHDCDRISGRNGVVLLLVTLHEQS
jgi:hypothetical protein